MRIQWSLVLEQLGTYPHAQFQRIEDKRPLEALGLKDEEASRLLLAIAKSTRHYFEFFDSLMDFPVDNLHPDGVGRVTGAKGEHFPVENAAGQRELHKVQRVQLKMEEFVETGVVKGIL